MIILNTPHNPTGKVFSQSELETIAALCKKYNVVCLSDEVYEWLVYKPAKHIRIGKTFLSLVGECKVILIILVVTITGLQQDRNHWKTVPTGNKMVTT